MREIVGVLYSIVEVLETIAGYLEPSSKTTSVHGDTREEEQKEEPEVEEVAVKKTTRSK